MAVKIKGGERIRAYLKELEGKVQNAKAVKAGFLEGATYPDGTPVAYIASIQEFGGKVNVPEKETTVYRSVNPDGSFKRDGKFVKRGSSNFATTHTVPAHEIVIPPRPFFRGAIAKNKDEWGKVLGISLKRSGYSAATALATVGQKMVEDIQGSIIDFSDPPNSPSTVRKKGYNNPLLHTRVMLRAVDAEVDE
ncbi:hypothetical protein HK16_05810 [Acetobacter senegalensis]|uniref:Phage protein n=2 Tax=Acetobacter TaxID=434 RepID=A0A252EKW2_9PROT|nr:MULTISPECIES: hypothetical protein [Acetobacter]ATJ91544.1 hypothetical protein CIW82_13425 [Acetobacter tropicalis]OUL67067.1 hypothetical protein HK16_05810 [Acetobacter senegalensis]